MGKGHFQLLSCKNKSSYFQEGIILSNILYFTVFLGFWLPIFNGVDS